MGVATGGCTRCGCRQDSIGTRCIFSPQQVEVFAFCTASPVEPQVSKQGPHEQVCGASKTTALGVEDVTLL